MTLGERDPEAKVADLRSNALVLAIPSLLLLVVAAALGFVYFRLPEEWQRWTAIGTAAFVVLVGFVLPLAAWLARRYTVTTRRTIIRDGLVRRSRREILHAKVVEVRLERHPGQALAGSGHVILDLGQGGRAVLRGVRSPRLVQEALTDLVEAQRVEAGRRSTGDTGHPR